MSSACPKWKDVGCHLCFGPLDRQRPGNGLCLLILSLHGTAPVAPVSSASKDNAVSSIRNSVKPQSKHTTR